MVLLALFVPDLVTYKSTCFFFLFVQSFPLLWQSAMSFFLSPIKIGLVLKESYMHVNVCTFSCRLTSENQILCVAIHSNVSAEREGRGAPAEA